MISKPKSYRMIVRIFAESLTKSHGASARDRSVQSSTQSIRLRFTLYASMAKFADNLFSGLSLSFPNIIAPSITSSPLLFAFALVLEDCLR